jgi:two-component system, chemotaxis family, chemotaxis protein CheY
MAFRILIVEDSVETLQLMTGMLESLGGIEVLPRSDSQLAVAMINGEKFDGIFLDLEMPRLDGLELTKVVRASTWNRTTPIIIVSGSNDHQAMAQGFQAGANFFLPKPVDRARMARLLNTTRGTMLASRRGLQRAALQVLLKREDIRTHLPLHCANISERGLLLVGDSTLRPGAEIKLSFVLPRQPERITVLATVARLDDYGRAGVNFRNLRHTDQQRIRTYVAEELATTDPAVSPSRSQRVSA